MTVMEPGLPALPTRQDWTRASAAMSAGSPSAWRRSTEPASGQPLTAAHAATGDWDLLFRAALELLTRLAIERPAPEGTAARLQAPGTALRECMDALDQLRRSVPPQRVQETGGSARLLDRAPIDCDAVRRDEARIQAGQRVSK